jgi:preprotein translocase subunit SecF
LSDPFCEEKQMSKIKNLVVLFAAIAVAIGLFSIFSGDSSNTEVKFSTEIPQPQQQTKSEPTAEVQTTPTVEVPFKKFLDQKAGNNNLAAKSDNSQALPVQPSKDPFKEFLDKQKQNSKDQVVSPFGKN